MNLVERLEEMSQAPGHHPDDRATWAKAADRITDLDREALLAIRLRPAIVLAISRLEVGLADAALVGLRHALASDDEARGVDQATEGSDG